jgi:succinylglutamate desuccinylase
MDQGVIEVISVRDWQSHSALFQLHLSIRIAADAVARQDVGWWCLFLEQVLHTNNWLIDEHCATREMLHFKFAIPKKVWLLRTRHLAKWSMCQ